MISISERNVSSNNDNNQTHVPQENSSNVNTVQNISVGVLLPGAVEEDNTLLLTAKSVSDALELPL